MLENGKKATARRPSAAGGWLFKEEPDHYSYADLEQAGETVWDGVSNALALKHLRQVKPGDRVLYYHTGKERAVVGEMRVVAGPTETAGGVSVTVAPVRRWPRAVGLSEIKQEDDLAGWELVRLPRLSVLPVSPAVWSRLEEMSQKRSD